MVVSSLATVFDNSWFSGNFFSEEHRVRLDPAAEQWDSEHIPFQLPPHVTLALGDVQGGTSTPSFVRSVLDWRKNQPEEGVTVFCLLVVFQPSWLPRNQSVSGVRSLCLMAVPFGCQPRGGKAASGAW